MTNQELRLSVGASPGQRVVAVVAGVLLAAVGVAFVALPLFADGLLRRLTGPGDAFSSYEEARDLPPGLLPSGLRDSADPNQSGPSPFIGLCGLPFVLLGLYLVLRVLRTAAWLEGSRVRVRGALRTRTVDLATARIESGAVSYREADDDGPAGGPQVRAILVTDPGSTRGVTIPLAAWGCPACRRPSCGRWPRRSRRLDRATGGTVTRMPWSTTCTAWRSARRPTEAAAQPPGPEQCGWWGQWV